MIHCSAPTKRRLHHLARHIIHIILIMKFFITFFALVVGLVSASYQGWENRLTADSGDANKFSSDGMIIKSGNETVQSYGWTEYKQCDSKWGNNQLGTCSQTICSAGCAMSSVAMILTTKVICFIFLTLMCILAMYNLVIYFTLINRVSRRTLGV